MSFEKTPDNSPDNQTRSLIGAQICQTREQVGMSTEELARKLNLRPAFIIAVEEGRGADHMDWPYERIHLRTIARVLNMNLDQFLESGGSEPAR